MKSSVLNISTTFSALWSLSIAIVFLLSSASSSAHYLSQLPCHLHPIPTTHHRNSLFSPHLPPLPHYCFLHHLPRNHRLPNTPPLPPPILGSPPTTAAPDQGEEEMDPRYGVEKRLVPTGPNPLHN